MFTFMFNSGRIKVPWRKKSSGGLNAVEEGYIDVQEGYMLFRRIYVNNQF